MIHSAVQPAQGADHVRTLLIDHEKRVWIGHDTGVIVLRPESDRLNVSSLIYPSRESQAIGKVTLPAIAGAAARYTTQDGVSGGMVRALLQSSDGHVWIATLDGLTQFDGERFRRSPKPTACRAGRRWPKTAMATCGLEPQAVARCGLPGMDSPLIRRLTGLSAPPFAPCCRARPETFTSSASTSLSIGSTGPGLQRFG